MECFNCGGDHFARDCPEGGKGKGKGKKGGPEPQRTFVESPTSGVRAQGSDTVVQTTLPPFVLQRHVSGFKGRPCLVVRAPLRKQKESEHLEVVSTKTKLSFSCQRPTLGFSNLAGLATWQETRCLK